MGGSNGKTSGLFTHEDVALDFIDISTPYDFKTAWGMNTKNPESAYIIITNGTKERIIRYNNQNKSIENLMRLRRLVQRGNTLCYGSVSLKITGG